MRILFVIHVNLDRNSGAAGSVLALADAYRRRGHTVDLLSLDDVPRCIRGAWRLPSFAFLVATRIWRLRRDVDVVDASTGDAWIWAMLRPMLSDHQPVLVTRSHGLEHTVHDQVLRDHRLKVRRLGWRYPLYNGSVRLWEVAVSLRHADLALFLNHDDRDVAVKRLRVRGERAHVAHNGLSDDLVSRARGERPAPVDAERIALLGTFIERKGIAYSVPVLNGWLRSRPEASVTLVGTGLAATDVLSQFRASVRSRVHVVESYDHRELPQLLKGHTVAVLASVAEGFGKNLLEAMACGLAPIATDVSGPREFIRHEVNGLLVPPRDAGALTRALQALADDPARLERYRVAAQATAADFGWDDLAAERLTLYAAAIAGLNTAPARRRPYTVTRLDRRG